MHEEGIKTVLKGLGLSKIRTRNSIRGDFVRASCPFIYNHSKLVDEHPSFAVSVHIDKPSTYMCFTCQKKAPLSVLVKNVEKHLGRQYEKDLHKLVETDGAFNVSHLQDKIRQSSLWKPSTIINGVRISNKKKGRLEQGQPPCSFSEEKLSTFQNHSLESMLYLTGPERKLILQSILTWQIGWNNQSRIVIPIRDVEGMLIACSGRFFDPRGRPRPKKAPKYLHSKGFKRDYILFGEHLKVPTRKAYLFEGFFHVIYMYQLGYRNVLAVMGTYLSEIQEKKVKKWFDEVVIVADGDKPGEEFAARVGDVLKGHCRTSVYYCPQGLDINDLSEEEATQLVGPPF